MAKITLANILSGFNLTKINDNFQKIQDVINDKVLFRDNPALEPNAMDQDLDMNNHKILNAKDVEINGVSLKETANIAIDAADRAKQSADLAKASEDAAALSEADAHVSMLEAQAARDLAVASADGVDQYVDEARVARDEAVSAETNAKASELASKASEDNSKVSELNSKASEDNSKESELAAKASEIASKASEINSKESELNSKASEIAAAASAASVDLGNTLNRFNDYFIEGKWRFNNAVDFRHQVDFNTGYVTFHQAPEFKTHVYFNSGISVSALNGGHLHGIGNRLINGDFQVNQYSNDVAIIPTTSRYVIDRWLAGVSQPSKLTFQRVTDAPEGFTYSMKISVNSKYAPAASEAFSLQQLIEGLNVVDFAFGTGSAKFVMFSTMIKGTVPGTYAVSLANHNGTESIVGTMTVTASWKPITVSFSGDNFGTWLKNSGTGLSLRIDLGSGSSFTTTADGWKSGNFTTTASCVKLVDQPVGSALYVTGLQLEPGAIVTPYERIDCSDVLRRCQRYFEVGSATSILRGTTLTEHYIPIMFKVSKRATPTITRTGIGATAGTDGTKIGGITVNDFLFYKLTGDTNTNDVGGDWIASAELS